MHRDDPIDMPAFRRHVRARILAELAQSGGATRSEVMDALVLSRTALTRVLEPMFEAGEVIEDDAPSGVRRRGRPARVLRIRRPPLSTLAVQISHDSLLAARVDESGNVLAVLREGVGTSSDFDTVRTIIATAAHRLRKASDAPFDRCIVAVPTIVHPDGSHVMTSGAEAIMPSWIGDTQVPRIAEAVDAPTWLINDGHFGALAEARLGSGRHVDSLLYIALGDNGIGGGLIINRELYRGSGFAGEISHVNVARRGVLCPCGRRGCVAAEVRAAVRKIKALANETSTHSVESCDQLQARVVDDVARAIAGVINLVHPNHLVISNRFAARLVGDIAPEVIERVRSRAHPEIAATLSIVESTLAPDLAIGALGLVDPRSRTGADAREIDL